MSNPETIEIHGFSTIHKLCKFGADHNMEGCSFTEIVDRMFVELAKSQAVPEGFVLVPYDVAERCMGHISIAMCHPNNTNAENDVMQMDLDILESRVEAQEQSHE